LVIFREHGKSLVSMQLDFCNKGLCNLHFLLRVCTIPLSKVVVIKNLICKNSALDKCLGDFLASRLVDLLGYFCNQDIFLFICIQLVELSALLTVQASQKTTHLVSSNTRSKFSKAMVVRLPSYLIVLPASRS